MSDEGRFFATCAVTTVGTVVLCLLLIGMTQCQMRRDKLDFERFKIEHAEKKAIPER